MLAFGILLVVFVVFLFWRMAKSGKIQSQTSAGAQQPVTEREVVREIVKIRCSYCGNLYDESQDKCPHCGAKR